MSERTFNPASADIDLATDAICQDCGKERWEHRDGGMVYGLVCPARSTPAEPLDMLQRWLGPIEPDGEGDENQHWANHPEWPDDEPMLISVTVGDLRKTAALLARLRSPESDRTEGADE